MAVAAATEKPSPPARVVVVAVLVLVRFVLALMLAIGRVLLVAARAVPYLGFATSWLFSAGLAATIVARRLCSECSAASLVLLEAHLSVAACKACVCVTFLLFAREALLMCVQCLAYLLAVVSGSGSEFKKSAFGAISQESAEKSIKLPRAVVRGSVLHPANRRWFYAKDDGVACRGIDISGRNNWFCDRGCGEIWHPCHILLCYHSSFST